MLQILPNDILWAGARHKCYGKNKMALFPKGFAGHKEQWVPGKEPHGG